MKKNWKANDLKYEYDKFYHITSLGAGARLILITLFYNKKVLSLELETVVFQHCI